MYYFDNRWESHIFIVMTVAFYQRHPASTIIVLIVFATNILRIERRMKMHQ